MARKKISVCMVKGMLTRAGKVDFDADYHALNSNAKYALAEFARQAGYRKSKHSQSSLPTSGTFFYYLARKKCGVANLGRARKTKKRSR